MIQKVHCDWGGKEECINLDCVHRGPHEHGVIIIEIGTMKIPSKCKNNTYCVLIRDECNCVPICGDEIDIE